MENARAAYDGTVAAYRQTVLSAFQEVEDDLASLRYLAEEAVQQQEAVVAAQESLDLEIAALSGRNGFLSERHHDSDHRIERPADGHHHPAAPDDARQWIW